MLFRFKEVDSPLCSYCNEEEEIPLHLFHIVSRGVLTPYFMKTPPYIANPSFFKFCPTPPPSFPVTSSPHPHGSFCCHISLAEWVIDLMCYFI